MVQPLSSGSVNSEYACNDVKTQIAVKLFKDMQENQKIAGDIIQDTVEISQEALNKCIDNC